MWIDAHNLKLHQLGKRYIPVYLYGMRLPTTYLLRGKYLPRYLAPLQVYLNSNCDVHPEKKTLQKSRYLSRGANAPP